MREPQLKLPAPCLTRVEALAGTYALLLLPIAMASVQIGRLGILNLRSGFYVYVGSALGSGGVRARLAHHLMASIRPHWHVDYLRLHTTIEEVWYCLDGSRREHSWAQRLRTAAGAFLPLIGFGASDCRCDAHLYFFEIWSSHDRFRRLLGRGVKCASYSRRRT